MKNIELHDICYSNCWFCGERPGDNGNWLIKANHDNISIPICFTCLLQLRDEIEENI